MTTRISSEPACSGRVSRLVKTAAMTAVVVDPVNGGLPLVA